MEAAFQGDFGFVDALSQSRTLLRVAPKIRAAHVGEVIREARDRAREAIRLAMEVRDSYYDFLRLPDQLQTGEALRSGLAQLGLIADALEEFARFAESSESTRDVLGSVLGEMAQLADQLRDLEETFALGLNPGFQEEIKRAKEAI